MRQKVATDIQPAEITMFQISEVQESPAFTDRRSGAVFSAVFAHRHLDAVGCILVGV